MLEIKTVVVGDTDAGKTSLSERFCYGDALMSASPTIGASFLQKRVSLQDEAGVGSHDVALHLWDTAGQERFRSMAPMYYRGATAAIIVFDCSKERAWDTLMSWQKDLMTYAEPGVIIGVAGNKVDKPKASGFELKRLCEACADWDASLHFTSALTGEGVDDLFLTVAKRSAAHVAAQRKNIDSVRVATAESPNLPCC
mmetsp:Transcript_20115/g.59965  ORF Transcript_20115/g.59965 Transcript_20115/m.59965 type:complete len:198 (-) Transcript_20115:204-797(-)